MKRYNPKEIEPNWQKSWEEQGIHRASEDPTKPKRYVLEYFPYPSGAAMHVGHVRNYTIGDSIARFYRMQGHNVLHPMGWDAFGLPAENYAIKTGISPRQAVDENTTKFKKQLMQMGFGYDWSREVDSTDPNYYKWTQWFFLLLFKRGLAYQKESLQWWCPVDKTVLANEQVEAGKCWRCGSDVEKKSLKQWFFKITEYADRLIDGLDDLNWSESIKSMQRNWIGRSQGAEVDFTVDESDEKIKVYTTRPDTLFGATFIVLAPEHPLPLEITKKPNINEVEDYIKQTQAKSDIERQDTEREKTGVFTGAYAINPANNEKIPIWVADYVLSGYGTGAIMAVPAHDERDWEFAKKFDLPITEVVSPYITEGGKNAAKDNAETLKRHIVDLIIMNDKGEYLLQVEPDNIHFAGGGVDPEDKDDEAAIRRELLEETGFSDIASIMQVSSTVTTYYFRIPKNKNQLCDGIFYEVKLASLKQEKSEIEEGKHTVRWVEKDKVADLITWEGHAFAWQQYLSGTRCHAGEGVLMNSGKFNGMKSEEAREKIVLDLAKQKSGSEKVNYKIRDWLISRQRYWGAPIPIIHCPKDGAVAVPEEQLPVILPEIKSYEPSGDGRSPLANVPEFVNTTCPKCGGKAERETDTMDGFACSSWYFLRFADPKNSHAPFDPNKAKFWLPVDDYIGGAEHAVMHLLYARFWTKVMFDERLIDFEEPFTTLRNQGMILAPDGQKMSKSKGNTIEPGGLIEQGYGADAIRIMELFIGPWNQSANWSIDGIGGAHRFLQRVWTIVHEYIESSRINKPATSSHDDELIRLTHKSIAAVSADLHELGFNTAIAALMELTNNLYKYKAKTAFDQDENWGKSLNILVQLLAPFAPHISEQLWQDLGNPGSVHVSSWPKHDDKYLMSDTMNIVVQVNGKLRANLSVPTNSTESDIIAVAKADSKVAAYLKDQNIKKQVYVPKKLINFVI